MNASAGEPPSMASGWQQTPEAVGPSHVAIYMRRLLLLLVLISFLIALLFYVFFPAFQPRTHLAVLHADGLRILDGPPIAVAGKELTLLDQFEGKHDFAGLLRSPETMLSLSQELAALQIRSKDAFILYIAAHGVTYDGQAQLLCSNFDPTDPGDGLFPMERLLSQLRALPPETTKLLILDAGQLDYDPRLGVVVSDFPRLLKDHVQRTKDPSLWVLCSHSTAEKSHRALRRSVFGTFAIRGLLGEAVTEDRKTIAPDDLSDFVKQRVGTWVSESSNDQATQRPQLIWGGEGDLPEEIPGLPLVGGQDLPELMADMRVDAGRQSPYVDRDGEPQGLLSRAATTPEDELGPGAVSEAQTAVDSPDGQSPATQADGIPDQMAANGSATSDGGAAPSKAEDRRHKLDSLVARMWQLRDRLNGTDDLDSSLSRAVDETPHLWRELQEELLAYEHILTSGQATEADLASLEAVLETALPLFFTSPEDEQDLVHDLSTLNNANASSPISGRQIVIEDARSLALAKLAADHGWFTPSDNVDELLTQFNDTIRLPAAEFSTWVAEKTSWEAHYDRYYELRLVKELSNVANLAPPLYQLALLVRRDGERIAASEPWCSDWIQEDVEAADRMRLAGERQILDQVGSDWSHLAQQQLTEALERYRAAEDKLADVRRATRLRNELVFRAPYYVRWHRASHERSGDEGTMYALAEFLNTLISLSSVLDAPAGHNVARVNQLRATLARLHVDAIAVNDADVASLTRSPTSGDAWRVNRLLETPLPSSQARRQLLFAAEYLVVDLARSFESKKATESASGDDWNRMVSLCGLEMQMAQLATWQAAGTEDQFQTLQDSFARLQDTLRTSSESSAASTVNEDRWPAFNSFTHNLRVFYNELHLRVGSDRLPQGETVLRVDEHRRAVQGKRALQLINARDAWRFRGVGVTQLLGRLHLHDMLAWHRQRFVVAQSDARQTEYDFLRNGSEAYRRQALKLLRSPALAASAGQQIVIESPQLVSLMNQSERDITVAFAYRGAAETDAWVILQYDPDVISVRAPPHVYHEHQLPGKFALDLSNAQLRDDADHLTRQIQRAQAYPYRPDLASHPASFRGLRNSDTRSFHLTVSAKTASVDSAQIIVKVIEPPRRTNAEGQRRAPALAYVRRPIEITLRTFDLVVDGDYGSWTRSQRDLTLHPFPNRITSYRLGAVNTAEKERNLAVRFMIPNQPVNLQQLGREEIAEVVSNAVSLDPMTVVLPADGMAHPLGKAADPQPAEAEAAASEADDAAVDEGPKPPAGPALTHGLLVEMSDAEDPRQRLLRHIKVVPQRPRRYIRPLVSYNARLERIEVKVLPRDEMLLPEGPIKVECEIAEDLAAGTEGKLHDTLHAPHKPQAGLFVNVPATPPQLLTLYIHVDDYPRAFIYKVPCGGQTIGLPEATELVNIRLLAPETIDGFLAPAATTPIKIQVDAPVGSFERGDDRLAVALDLDRDSQLDTESAAQFTLDRQADSFLDSLVDGKLSLDTRVTDFQSPLPTNRLQNVDVDVLARIDVGETGGDVEPLTLRIDGAPPRIIWVALNPTGGTVVAGNELEVNVWARDNMSGVKSVQAAFDIDGIGKFAPEAKLTKFVLDPQTKRWNAKFATEELFGIQTLLVQATDRVGNASQAIPVSIRVLTEQQNATVTQARPMLLQGTVTFNGKPIPNAQLQLTAVDGPADGPEFPPVMANEQGQFTFLRVLPGAYNLTARGVVYNVPRRGFRELTIAPDAERIVPADVELQ